MYDSKQTELSGANKLSEFAAEFRGLENERKEYLNHFF